MTAAEHHDARALLALYDAALPVVFGYLLRRCGERTTAEDLASETFLAAAAAVRRGTAARLDVAWLIGVARHKLADHWRREAREERRLRAVADLAITEEPGPGAPAHLDALLARRTLDRLAPHHRATLTFRYVDDLPVADVARLLDRTLHATEALLVRAKAAFREEYDTAPQRRTRMSDPFTGLRAADTPVTPDPKFAARLRVRIERALALPRGVVPMTTIETSVPVRGAAVPYLAVADARAAIDWYVEHLDAELVGEPIGMPDGRIGHAELALGGGTLYLADEYPEIGVVAPSGGASVSLLLAVPDADTARARAVAAGASGDRPPYDGYGERNAWIVDPFGHRWCLQSPLTQAQWAFRHGDLAHVSVRTPDAGAAAEFYRAVLGWDVVEDRVPAATPSVGIWTAPEPTLLCVYEVEDLDVARERVVAAGGTAGEPRQEPYGLRSECTDDQGVAFSIHEVPGGGTERPPLNGRRQGDLSYLTLEVVDSAKARTFYGAVLGWTFHPGRIEDGWEVADTVPMTGLSGGHERAAAVPMWRVDDIAAAVAAVRAGGGTATDPVRQPYGEMSECADPQGSRFYLGQH